MKYGFIIMKAAKSVSASCRDEIRIAKQEYKYAM